MKLGELLGMLGIGEEDIKPEYREKNVEDIIEKWLKLPEVVEDIERCHYLANWVRVIECVHELTTLIKRYGFRVEADVAPETTFHYHLTLVGTDKCCVCPIAKYRSSLGPEVYLTVLVNHDADVPLEWKDKYPFINEPMPTEFTWSPYVDIPKRVVDVYFTNTNKNDTAVNTRFYAKYDEMDFNKGKKLVKNFFEKFSRKIVELTLPG